MGICLKASRGSWLTGPLDCKEVMGSQLNKKTALISGDSGANASYLELADGLIVGTWAKRAGKLTDPVDRNRVAALRKAIS